MDDIFTEVDTQTNADDNLEVLAQKFGVTLTPENEKILKAKAESDRFIEQLKRETAELRQEVSSKATIDEILTKIKESQGDVQPPNPVPQVPNQPDTPDVESLVTTLIEKREAERLTRQNEQVVADKLREKFGNDAALHLNQKARELNTSVKELQEIARRNPQMFFRLTGLDQAPVSAPTQVAPQSRLNVPPTPANVRDRKYYENLKRTDKKKYFSPETQLQLYKDQFAALQAGKEW